MEMLLALMGLFIVCLFVFFAIAFFLPEWLGITGKKAQEVMRHQRGEDEVESPKSAPQPGKANTPPQ